MEKNILFGVLVGIKVFESEMDNLKIISEFSRHTSNFFTYIVSKNNGKIIWQENTAKLSEGIFLARRFAEKMN